MPDELYPIVPSDKTFTAGGEGGMVTTDDEDLAWKARSFRDDGYDVQERLNLLELERKLPYIHNIVGWNYRMTEMQSAIGLAELERMDTWNLPRRRKNAQVLMNALKKVPQIRYMPVDTPERRNGWYVMAFSVDVVSMTCDISQFVKAVGAEGAPVWKVFWPQCHVEKAYRAQTHSDGPVFPSSRKSTRVAAPSTSSPAWSCEAIRMTCFVSRSSRTCR